MSWIDEISAKKKTLWYVQHAVYDDHEQQNAATFVHV